MNKTESYPRGNSLLAVGLLFLLISTILTKIVPCPQMLPDLALILTLFTALKFNSDRGLVLSVFAGAYVGVYSSFPMEYMALYGLIFFGVRFVSSFFQFSFVGYPIFLAFLLEMLIGVIHGIEIFLKQPQIFSLEVVGKIVLLQSLVTAIYLYPIFVLFERFSRNLFTSSNRVLK